VLGYVIVGLFLATWVISVTVWRLARIEERSGTEGAG
jgi:high-affinity nickel-transport protein